VSDDSESYKRVSINKVVFGYSFKELKDLVKSENKLIKNLEGYIRSTEKVLETTTLFSSNGEFVLEISISTNDKR
jgi:hypothetical protein